MEEEMDGTVLKCCRNERKEGDSGIFLGICFIDLHVDLEAPPPSLEF